MDILQTIVKTISAMFAAFLPRTQPQYRAPQPRPVQAATRPPQPHPKTAFQRLIELNPVYGTMNLTPDLVNAHLPVEEKMAQQKQEKESQKHVWYATQDAKKQHAEIHANQMQETQRTEYMRQLQHTQEIASIEQKYAVYQQPVQFA